MPYSDHGGARKVSADHVARALNLPCAEVRDANVGAAGVPFYQIGNKQYGLRRVVQDRWNGLDHLPWHMMFPGIYDEEVRNYEGKLVVDEGSNDVMVRTVA